MCTCRILEKINFQDKRPLEEGGRKDETLARDRHDFCTNDGRQECACATGKTYHRAFVSSFHASWTQEHAETDTHFVRRGAFHVSTRFNETAAERREPELRANALQTEQQEQKHMTNRTLQSDWFVWKRDFIMIRSSSA